MDTYVLLPAVSFYEWLSPEKSRRGTLKHETYSFVSISLLKQENTPSTHFQLRVVETTKSLFISRRHVSFKKIENFLPSYEPKSKFQFPAKTIGIL